MTYVGCTFTELIVIFYVRPRYIRVVVLLTVVLLCLPVPLIWLTGQSESIIRKQIFDEVRREWRDKRQWGHFLELVIPEQVQVLSSRVNETNLFINECCSR